MLTKVKMSCIVRAISEYVYVRKHIIRQLKNISRMSDRKI